MTMLPKMRRKTDKHLTDAASGIAGLAKEVIDLRAALSAAEGLVAVLREALEKARIVFAGYTQLHLRKSPPDMVKGLRNKELADMCLAALSTTPATRTLGRTPT